MYLRLTKMIKITKLPNSEESWPPPSIDGGGFHLAIWPFGNLAIWPFAPTLPPFRQGVRGLNASRKTPVRSAPAALHPASRKEVVHGSDPNAARRSAARELLPHQRHREAREARRPGAREPRVVQPPGQGQGQAVRAERRSHQALARRRGPALRHRAAPAHQGQRRGR